MTDVTSDPLAAAPLEGAGAPLDGVEPPSIAEGPDSFQSMIDQAMDMVAAGGPVVVILLGCSIVALTIIFLKLWQFRVAKVWDRRAVDGALALLRAGQTEKARQMALASANPVAQVLAGAIYGHRAMMAKEALLREEILRCGRDHLESLRSHLGTLEMIGNLAPLLGLFGTVLGMIDAFQDLSAAGSNVNPSVLSEGIWEALLTTAVGLAVAIPVVAVVNWLQGTVERVAHDMDNAVTQVFTNDLALMPTSPEEPRGFHATAAVPGE